MSNNIRCLAFALVIATGMSSIHINAESPKESSSYLSTAWHKIKYGIGFVLAVNGAIATPAGIVLRCLSDADDDNGNLVANALIIAGIPALVLGFHLMNSSTNAKIEKALSQTPQKKKKQVRFAEPIAESKQASA